MNTERRKVNRVDGELESDCREMTAERLLEFLQQSTNKDVQSLSRKLNIKPQGSKLEMVMRIKQEMQKDNQKFKKAFTKLWGCTGGWVSATCVHMV